ncbi:MAG: glycosyltransferase family 9 protein [Proteobacteria bacterium]|jgi:ADP-heptose:LPS heptosyltransferase|nr:glycosyltransferase family 9 protein [Pseudomonadota bacterium]
MKILVLSLQRLGDVLQHLELVERIKVKYPDAEVHLMVNDTVKLPRAVLSQVSQVHQFPRSELQKILTHRNVFVLRAHKILKQLIQKIRAEKFTACYNFTHTQAAFDFVGLLKVTPTYGLGGDSENIWSSVLNETTHPVRSQLFQINDLIAFSTGLGQVISKNVRPFQGKKILIQPLTSDVKKNWGLANYSQLFEQLSSKGYQVKVIGADFERAELESWFKIEALLIGDLEKAVEWIKDSDLVISGDTAMIHLASLFRVQSVGLYLGSGDFLQTAPRLVGPVLLTGAVDCYPCKHSAPCTKIKHFCGEALSLTQVLEAVNSVMNQGNPCPFKKVERGFLGQIVIRENSYSSFEREVQQVAFKEAIDQVEFPEVGSFAIQIAAAKFVHPSFLDQLSSRLSELARQSSILEEHLQQLQLSISDTEKFRLSAAEMMTLVNKFQTENSTLGWDFFPLVEVLSKRHLTNFLKLREIKRALEFLQKSRDTKERVLSQLLQKALTKESVNVQQF